VDWFLDLPRRSLAGAFTLVPIAHRNGKLACALTSFHLGGYGLPIFILVSGPVSARHTSIRVERRLDPIIPDDEARSARVIAEGELSLPRVPEPADPNDVLREQLEYLIDHTERGVLRLPRVRTLPAYPSNAARHL
jgi:hypothetical protein